MRPKHEISGVASYYLVIIAVDVDKKEVFIWFLPIKNPLAKLFSHYSLRLEIFRRQIYFKLRTLYFQLVGGHGYKLAGLIGWYYKRMFF
jgi:hypothetical protein